MDDDRQLLERLAKEAINEVILAASVFVGFGEQGRQGVRGAIDHGSGLVFRAASGELVILSARHVLALAAENSAFILHRGIQFAQPATLQVVGHPDGDVDVALALVDMAAIPGLVPLERDRIALDADYLGGDGYLIHGFPVQLRQVTEVGTNLRDHWMGSITYLTNLKGRDQKRLSLNFAEATPVGPSPALEMVELDERDSFQLKKPSGISGGGVWQLRRPPADQLWTFTACARLVGIAIEYAKRTQRAEPVARWAAWVVDQLRSL